MNKKHPFDSESASMYARILAVSIAIFGCSFHQTSFAAAPPLSAEVIFDPTHLVNVVIKMDDQDWQILCGQSRDFLEALGEGSGEKPFTYFPADVTIDGVTISKVGIRKKGFLGSLDDVRPALKIKFDEYVEQDPAVGFDRLTLNNNKQDPSRLSQYLSYKIFNDSGTVAPRCNFAKVTVNGTYLGIYSNVESVKPPFLKQRFGDDSGALFEGTVVDFLEDSVGRFEKKNKHAKNKYLTELSELIEKKSFTIGEVDELLDIRAFVKFWATESLIGFWDGYTNNQNNFFVYRHPQTKKFVFIPWGTDSSFTNSMPIAPFRIKVKSVHAQSVLANRLYRHPEIQALYLETMNELLKTTWNEDALIADIDRVGKLLKGHILKNNSGYSRKVESVTAFIRGRRAVMNAELKDGAVKISHGPRKPVYFEITGSATASFSTQWYEKPPSNAIEQGEAKMEVTVNGEQIEFKQLGVTAEPSRDKNNKEADGRLPPTVVFSGRRESDGKQWMLAIGTSSQAFQPSTKPVPVMGIVIEGNPIFFFARMALNLGNLTLASGTATFDEAKREVGAPVSGVLKVNFARFGGGKHLPR